MRSLISDRHVGYRTRRRDSDRESDAQLASGKGGDIDGDGDLASRLLGRNRESDLEIKVAAAQPQSASRPFQDQGRTLRMPEDLKPWSHASSNCHPVR